MTRTRITLRTCLGAAKVSPRSRHAELLILCARLGFNP
jgi:hypothetical protein